MNKRKSKSDSRVFSKSEIKLKEEIVSPPLDVLTVKILNLRIPDKRPKSFIIKVMFFEQLIINRVIYSTWNKDIVKEETIAQGSLDYDPSDYEKMCLFADTPLIVTIQPVRNTLSNDFSDSNAVKTTTSKQSLVTLGAETVANINCCNVDILPVLIDTDIMCVRLRMQPVRKPSVLHATSWDNLPLISMELSVARDEANEKHHNIFSLTNYMQLTLIGAYNMPIQYNEENEYIAATKTAMLNETNCEVITFIQGYRMPKNFCHMSFYPKWESLRIDELTNPDQQERLDFKLENIQNDDNIYLKYYFDSSLNLYTVLWASFHRTLMVEQTETWFMNFIRQHYWPLEVRVNTEQDSYNLMAFLDLFKLLYPGENRVRIAVPLYWYNREELKQKCDCTSLFNTNDWMTSTPSTTQKTSRTLIDSARTTSSTNGQYVPPTGSDGRSAFIVVEVTLKRPLKKPTIPAYITNSEISKMLLEIENKPCQRECIGRGQLIQDWKNVITMATNSLRKIPYYGFTDFCTFTRQLSATRARIEMLTSFCQEAAVYVNNHFVVQNYLQSDETYEEMLMIAHACLMRSTRDTLLSTEDWPKLNSIIRAARHARQFQDIYHALDLYFHSVIEKPRDSDLWRELASCLRDVDNDWADICLDKALALNPRHALSLLSKACSVYKDNVDEAEPFFAALLYFHPFWTLGSVAASAYYRDRELFYMAEKVIEYTKLSQAEGLSASLNIPRAWEHELGEWWDSTPLLPGMSLYFDTADLLLRIRAPKLAQVCLAQALCTTGESAAYYHLLALCHRLSGDISNALCHIQTGITKYGEISYLRTLEAECHHVLRNCEESVAAFQKAEHCSSSYSVILSLLSRNPEQSRSSLVDLLRRQPSAYAWLALADDWIARSSKTEQPNRLENDTILKEESSAIISAVACAVEALKIDRYAGRAWALLSRFVKPNARRLYYKKMANSCGYNWVKERTEGSYTPRQARCYRVGRALRECCCKMCTRLSV